jgi:hypothetical protein
MFFHQCPCPQSGFTPCSAQPEALGFVKNNGKARTVPIKKTAAKIQQSIYNSTINIPTGVNVVPMAVLFMPVLPRFT